MIGNCGLIETQMRELAVRARRASRSMAHALPDSKKFFLLKLAELLGARSSEILDANKMDLDSAAQNGMDASRLDRLALNGKILEEMRSACLHVADLPDPVGATETQWQRPNGLLVGKMRIPLGVIAMIYEARPNVTIDSAILCAKAGNAVILRGGKEAINSNIILSDILRQALDQGGLPRDAAQLVQIPEHDAVTALCRMDDLIDVVIPRGGEKLIRAVCAAATMPVLKHYKGVCHAYVDRSADLEKAVVIVENAKTQRPGVCNALECLLVHKDVAQEFLPMVARRLAPHGVEFRACADSMALLGPTAVPLGPDDFGCEFHAPILAVAVVKNLDGALDHIDRYGSRHTEIICANDYVCAMRFLREVDASMVAVNASTRFNDGGQLGLGAEIGISTSKLHAYGPMGVNELTTTKFVVLGNGQIRE